MKITLQYNLPDKLNSENLEYITKLSESFKKNLSRLEGLTGISARAFLSGEYAESSYDVIISGESEKVIHITYNFLTECGVPHFVKGDFSFLEKPLNKVGKTLKRKFKGALVGKYVVDKGLSAKD